MAFSEKQYQGAVYQVSDQIGTRHAFTTRLGGVSRGIYASWNLGLHRGDDPARVAENYQILGEALGFPVEKLVFSHQVHGDVILPVTAADALQDLTAPVPYEADGLMTAEPGLPLIVFASDCIPILYHDPVGRAVAAVHAGWRGTVLDIAGKAVEQMGARFGSKPQDIRAAIGPGIGPCCFETGPEVPQAVLACLGDAGGAYILPVDGEKYMVDLKGVNRALLLRAGLLPEHIDVSPDCTKCEHETYWSHRYTNGRRGSQASVILLD